MPSPKKKAPTKAAKAPNAKELQQKCTELSDLSERLAVENAELKLKFKMICEKIAAHSDIEHYGYSSSLDAQTFDVHDLIHMVQVFVLRAAKLKSAEILGNQLNGLEQRIKELVSGESEMPLKERFKLQERLEFMKQERDVWKRNAETFKRMYTKLAKEKENNPPLAKLKTNISTITLQAPLCQPVIKRPVNSARPTTAVCCRVCKIRTATKPQGHQQPPYNDLDQTSLQTISSAEQQVHNSQSSLFQTFNTESIDITDFELSHRDKMEQPTIRNMVNRKKFEGIPSELQAHSVQKRFSVDSSNMSLSGEGRPLNSTRKNVSFNKEIDVGIFRKDSKNLKLIESYLQPLPVQNLQNIHADQQYQPQQAKEQQQPLANIQPLCEEPTIANGKGAQSPMLLKNGNIDRPAAAPPISSEVRDHLRTLFSSRADIDSVTSLYSLVNQRRTSSPLSSATTTSSDNAKYTNRASICSMRKFPGETPVKDLEPTLKMIIIKELSRERAEGNDWRLFARRIGISEKELDEWAALKLQYPMARVLSFWSSRPDATTRLLHRHLNAPCFDFSILAKRIENFYDVV